MYIYYIQHRKCDEYKYILRNLYSNTVHFMLLMVLWSHSWLNPQLLKCLLLHVIASEPFWVQWCERTLFPHVYGVEEQRGEVVVVSVAMTAERYILVNGCV